MERRNEKRIARHGEHGAERHVRPKGGSERMPLDSGHEGKHDDREQRVRHPDHHQRMDRALDEPLLEHVRQRVGDDPERDDEGGEHERNPNPSGRWSPHAPRVHSSRESLSQTIPMSFYRILAIAAIAALGHARPLSAQTAPSSRVATLDIYIADTEGGK